MDVRAKDTHEDAPVLPRSAVPQIVGLIGLASILVAFALVAVWRPADKATTFACLLLALALPMLAAELYLNRGAVFDGKLSPPNTARVAIKLYGLAVTVALIALAYWVFPIYRQQASALLSVLPIFAAPIALLSLPYVLFVDRKMQSPEDGLYMAGLAALGQWGRIDTSLLQQYLLGWLVKAFFGPLMLWYAWQDFDLLLRSPAEIIQSRPYGWYDYAYDIVWFIDVLYASIGYLCTFRLLGTHIRRAEDAAQGWLVCLICYAPFADVLFDNYLRYNESGHGWGYWFGSAAGAGSVWGLLILFVLAVHVWCTIIFGVRFSNLTNRGIITNGPYRWSKHPAYITKMTIYAMIWLPFLNAASLQIAVRHSIAFACLCGIYYLRARAEERYLMEDADYRRYCEYIARNGLVSVALRGLSRVWQQMAKVH